MRQLLIIEDDVLLNKTLCYNLTSDGFTITSAQNAKTAREHRQSGAGFFRAKSHALRKSTLPFGYGI